MSIPDDARDLDADVRALRRERRANQRKAIFNRIVFTPTRSPRKAVLPILIVIMLVAVAFAGLAVLIPQPSNSFGKPAGLAAPVRSIGQEGGLTPDIHLTGTGDSNSIKLRDIRPASIVAVPSGCQCDQQIRSVVTASQQHHLRTLLVSQTPPRLPAQTSNAGVISAADSTGQLTSLYHFSKEPGVLLVRADGIVNRALLKLPATNALNAELTGIQTR